MNATVQAIAKRLAMYYDEQHRNQEEEMDLEGFSLKSHVQVYNDEPVVAKRSIPLDMYEGEVYEDLVGYDIQSISCDADDERSEDSGKMMPPATDPNAIIISDLVQREVESVVLVDLEGAPTSEASLLHMVNLNHNEWVIAAVYHSLVRHTCAEVRSDARCREIVHGIPVDVLRFAKKDENIVRLEVRQFIDGIFRHYPDTIIMANDNTKENAWLGNFGYEYLAHSMKLPSWDIRGEQEWHQMTNILKNGQFQLGPMEKSCMRSNHAAYNPSSRHHKKNTLNQIYKHAHGYHCALYDCLEEAIFILHTLYEGQLFKLKLNNSDFYEYENGKAVVYRRLFSI